MTQAYDVIFRGKKIHIPAPPKGMIISYYEHWTACDFIENAKRGEYEKLKIDPLLTNAQMVMAFRTIINKVEGYEHTRRTMKEARAETSRSPFIKRNKK